MKVRVNAEEKMKSNLWRELISWIKTFIIVFAVVTAVQRFIISPVRVDGMSMYPTLQDGDGTLLWMFDYQPSLFDIVVFRESENNYYVKRIVGLPGNHVKYHQGILHIDGEPIEEIYTNNEIFIENFTLQDVCQFERCDVIPEGYFFVLGDNRHRSEDSRDLGLISGEQILGSVVWRHWPFSSFGRVKQLVE